MLCRDLQNVVSLSPTPKKEGKNERKRNNTYINYTVQERILMERNSTLYLHQLYF